MIQFSSKLQVTFVLLGIAAAISLGSLVSYIQERAAVATIQSEQAKILTSLKEFAVLTDRNEVDPELAKLIVDCGRRAEFESLLNNLAQLSKKDLLSMQALFENCGTFYAEKKSHMVARMIRELQNYDQLESIVRKFEHQKTPNTTREKWGQIVALEEGRRDMLTEQVAIQSRIITLLVTGSTPSSADTTQLLQQAQEIAQLLSVQDTQIDALRLSLTE